METARVAVPVREDGRHCERGRGSGSVLTIFNGCEEREGKILREV